MKKKKPLFRQIKEIKPSFAEKVIIKLLKKHNVDYCREVEFDTCINPLTEHKLRFDFYFPQVNLLVEYDGKVAHSTESARLRDNVKTKWAKKNKISLIRISGIHYIEPFFYNETKYKFDLGIKRKPKEPNLTIEQKKSIRTKDLEEAKSFYANHMKKFEKISDKNKKKSYTHKYI